MKNEINILAIDQATKTGWATKEASGTWDLKPKSSESAGMRIIRFKARIREVVEACDIKLVV